MKIKLRSRERKNGKSKLYLEKYYGLVNGKYKRKTEVLKRIWIYTNPKTKEERKHNKEQIILAEKFVTKLQNEYNHKQYGFINEDSQNANFIEFFCLLAETKDSKSNEGNWKSSYNYLIEYAGELVMFKEINVEFLEGFKRFLQKNAFAKKTGKQIAVNTQVSYFRNVKSAVKEAFIKGYLNINYAARVKGISEEETEREYLTQEEFERMATTPFQPNVMKRAFIFACLTGLRFVDVQKLTWNDIEEYKEGKYRLKFRQQKTKGLQYLVLHPQAVEQLGYKKALSERIFHGLKKYYPKLKQWATKAGVDKNVTYHTARHTHATFLMTYGVDLYIIKEILGHKHIQTTEIYTKIIDERKEKAMDKLPTFNI